MRSFCHLPATVLTACAVPGIDPSSTLGGVASSHATIQAAVDAPGGVASTRHRIPASTECGAISPLDLAPGPPEECGVHSAAPSREPWPAPGTQESS